MGGVGLAARQHLGQGRHLLARLEEATAAHQGQDAQQVQVPVVGIVAPGLDGPVISQEALAGLEQALDHLTPFRRGRRGPQGRGVHGAEAQRPITPKGSRVRTGWDI